MKRLDYFRKPKQDLEKSTCSGCLLTLFTYFFIIYLSVAVFQEYMSTSPFSKNFTIKSGFDNTNYFFISMDILFLNIPCPAFSFTKKDLAGQDETSVYSGLEFQRLSNNNVTIKSNYIDTSILPKQFVNSSAEVKKIVTGIQSGERCRVKGTITANKIPGRFIFDYRLKKDLLKHIKMNDKKLYEKINFSHIIKKFVFHTTILPGEVINDTAVNVNSLSSLEAIHDRVYTCNYYLKVIPVIIPRALYDDQHYQYSYHTECAVFLLSNTIRKKKWIWMQKSTSDMKQHQ